MDIIQKTNGYYLKCQYKAGTDIPAREYTLESISCLDYVEVPTVDMIYCSVVTNDNFKSNKIITVTDGQYLLFSDAKLKAN